MGLWLTSIDAIAEPLSSHWRVLLDVPLVVIEGAILPSLQLICILYHLYVQSIQGSVVDQVFQHYETVAGYRSNSDFEVTLIKTPVLQFGG
jgi:hypothetical protein